MKILLSIISLVTALTLCAQDSRTSVSIKTIKDSGEEFEILLATNAATPDNSRGGHFYCPLKIKYLIWTNEFYYLSDSTNGQNNVNHAGFCSLADLNDSMTNSEARLGYSFQATDSSQLIPRHWATNGFKFKFTEVHTNILADITLPSGKEYKDVWVDEGKSNGQKELLK